MERTITTQWINRAVATLRQSERGEQAMRDLLSMLDNGGAALDASGQAAILTLLVATFTTHPGSARSAMRDALADDLADGSWFSGRGEPAADEV